MASCTSGQPLGAPEVILDDLDLPRAIALADDGSLYVADAGNAQVSASGRLLKVVGRVATTVLAGIFNERAEVNGQTFLYGLSGAAVRGNTVYIDLGAGAFVTQPTVGQNRLVRIDDHGVVPIFAHERLEADRDPDGRGIDSNAGAVAVGQDGTIWTVDSSGNWLARLDASGGLISLVVFPDVDSGPAIPTGVAVSSKGEVFVSLFRCRQPSRGRGGIARITPPNGYEIVVDGLNSPVALAASPDDTLYILEFAVDYQPRSGRVLAVRQGSRKVVIDDLTYPTSLAWDPRGFLWVATGSPSGEPGTGQLLRYRIP